MVLLTHFQALAQTFRILVERNVPLGQARIVSGVQLTRFALVAIEPGRFQVSIPLTSHPAQLSRVLHLPLTGV